MSTNSKDLESQMDKYQRETNDKKKKMGEEYKSVERQFNELRQGSTSLAQSLKSASRSWTIAKPDHLLQNGKLVELLSTELRKGGGNQELEQIEEGVIGLTETLLRIIQDEMGKLEDGHLRKMEGKEREAEKAVGKEQWLS
jgi:hypothetical protein